MQTILLFTTQTKSSIARCHSLNQTNYSPRKCRICESGIRRNYKRLTLMPFARLVSNYIAYSCVGEYVHMTLFSITSHAKLHSSMDILRIYHHVRTGGDCRVEEKAYFNFNPLNHDKVGHDPECRCNCCPIYTKGEVPTGVQRFILTLFFNALRSKEILKLQLHRPVADSPMCRSVARYFRYSRPFLAPSGGFRHPVSRLVIFAGLTTYAWAG